MTDTKELAEAGPGTAVGQHTGGDSKSMLQIIADAARDPTVDAQKMVTLADLALKLKGHEQQEQFNRDKVAALLEMPMISKKGAILIPGKDGKPGRVQGRFAKFEDIMRVVVPILERHNLAISFKAGSVGPMVACAPVLQHRNGFTEVGEVLNFPIDTSGSKNNTQGVGSSTSYAKRQCTKACLNIIEIGEDDDGYGSGGHQMEMTDEQQAIVNAGSKAAAAGNFMPWFEGLAPNDRGWLVVSGQYDKLDPAAAKQAVQESQSADTFDRAGYEPEQGADPDPEPQQPAKRTPEQMVEGYEAKTREVPTLADLQDFQSEASTLRFIDKMKASRTDLHSKILAANAAAYDRLSN